MKSNRNNTKMRTKKPAAQQGVPEQKPLNSPNLSVIEKTSFLEGLVSTDGNPLHSTALEDDSNTCMAGPDVQQTKKEKKKSRPIKSKDTPNKEVARGRKSKVVPGKKTNTAKAAGLDNVADQKPAGRSSKVKQPPAPMVQLQPEGGDKENESGAGGSSEAVSEGVAARKRRSHILSDDDDDEEVEDESWQPSPKKVRRDQVISPKKSQTVRGSNKATTSGKKSSPGGTELDLILAAFEEFSAQYRDSVQSKAVQSALDMFADNVQSQLTEKISSEKRFMALKRENVTMAALISKKRQQLLQAKNEQMRMETELRQLKKEKADLKVRLSDLRKVNTLLGNVKPLTQRCLQRRH